MLILCKHELRILEDIDHILFLAHLDDTLVLHLAHLFGYVLDLRLDLVSLAGVLAAF